MPIKPSDAEEEFFKRQELERLKQERRAQASRILEAERKRLKELHWMRCPKCGMELAEVEFRSVKVDTCLTCGGVFFDAGEVDRLAEQEESGLLSRITTSLLRFRTS